MEFTEENAARVLEARINANGFDPSSVECIQKGLNAMLCTAHFTGDEASYQGVVTRDEVAAVEGE